MLFYYLFAVNSVGAIITFYDKCAARHGAWRISEKTLFLFCILGGCPGVYFTMRLIHHKTLHKRFMIGIPLIFLMQCAILGVLWYYIERYN